MSRILFDAFDATGVTGTITVSIANDFVVSAQGSQGHTGTIAVDITADLSVSGSGAVLFFIAPEPGDPRVAVVTHRN